MSVSHTTQHENAYYFQRRRAQSLRLRAGPRVKGRFRATPKRVVVQVKSGKVKSGDIRDLVGTVEREKATIGIFITLEPPSPKPPAQVLIIRPAGTRITRKSRS
jgi:hypothetical protein